MYLKRIAHTKILCKCLIGLGIAIEEALCFFGAATHDKPIIDEAYTALLGKQATDKTSGKVAFGIRLMVMMHAGKIGQLVGLHGKQIGW